MKLLKSHTLILALAAGLCLSVLAACSDEKEPQDTAPSTDAATVTVTETAPETEPETEPATETEAATTDSTDTAEPDESDAATETKAESEPAETEPVTAAPRYDYFAADVSPDVTIDAADYTDMKLTLPADLQITDANVMEYIEFIRFDYRTPDNGTERVTDKPMKIGDDAYIYYKGVIDGEEFEGGSNWDDESAYKLGLGSGAFIPGFETGLVGVIPAEATKEHPAEVKVTFPENYGNELAGKEAVFYVAVEYAVQYTLPTYNRQFVEETLQYEGEKNFYASDKAYLAEFEAYVRTHLEKEIADQVESAKITALWDYLTTKATCQNLPRIELDFYYNNYIAEIEYYYEYYTAYGGSAFTDKFPTMDDFARAYVGVEADGDWKAELSLYAERMVGRDMLAHAIAEREGIEVVTEAEYLAEIAYWVDYYGGHMTDDDVIQSMGEIALRESAFAAKMQDWLLARATFTFETAESN